MVHFGEFLKTWSLRSNSVTRQVSFHRTKNGGKCQNQKIQMLILEFQIQFRLRIQRLLLWRIFRKFVLCQKGFQVHTKRLLQFSFCQVQKAYRLKNSFQSSMHTVSGKSRQTWFFKLPPISRGFQVLPMRYLFQNYHKIQSI